MTSISKNCLSFSPRKLCLQITLLAKKSLWHQVWECLPKELQDKWCPVTPEEADTRLLVNVIDLLSAGCSTCLVHTVDTNVFVILVGKFNYLLRLNVSAKIWVAFGTGKNYKYLNINSICHALGAQKNLWPYLYYFTVLQVAIRLQLSWVRERKLHGKPGILSQKNGIKSSVFPSTGMLHNEHLQQNQQSRMC